MSVVAVTDEGTASARRADPEVTGDVAEKVQYILPVGVGPSRCVQEYCHLDVAEMTRWNTNSIDSTLLNSQQTRTDYALRQTHFSVCIERKINKRIFAIHRALRLIPFSSMKYSLQLHVCCLIALWLLCAYSLNELMFFCYLLYHVIFIGLLVPVFLCVVM